jgi:hypothetical protein
MSPIQQWLGIRPDGIGMPSECAINVSKTGPGIKQDCENTAFLGIGLYGLFDSVELNGVGIRAVSR